MAVAWIHLLTKGSVSFPPTPGFEVESLLASLEREHGRIVDWLEASPIEPSTRSAIRPSVSPGIAISTSTDRSASSGSGPETDPWRALATDHQNFLHSQHGSRRTDGVLELLAGHEVSSSEAANAR